MRDIYVQLSAEDQEDHEYEYDTSGKLGKAMYDSRDPAQNWPRMCVETVKELWVPRGERFPCHFNHPKRGVCGLVHRDNVVFAESILHLRHIATHMLTSSN